ncbi:hypothetical protein ANN_09386, partial [Periplaneta americana]
LPATTRHVRQFFSNKKNILQCKEQLHKLALTPEHKQAILKFAEKHMSWTSVWDKVIFSDEKKFNLDGLDGFQYYWHDLRTEQQVRISRNFCGGSVMNWAAFCVKVKSRIAWLNTRMNSNMYIEIIETQLIRIKRYRCLPWRASSPDLNPVQNLWEIFARDVYRNGRQCEAVCEMKRAIREEWAKISMQELKPLTKTMPKILFEVTRKNGGSSKY